MKEVAKRSWDFMQANIYQHTVEQFKYNLKIYNLGDPTAKRPIMGKTRLYFVSPGCGLSDINKWDFMPIKGNERFCDAICKLADKYFN